MMQMKISNSAHILTTKRMQLSGAVAANRNQNMKTREQIITSMCYTMRHDYGLNRDLSNGFVEELAAGMTQPERAALWRQMAQIFDNDIAPYMEFRS
jgi:hypothetical protein